MSFYLSKNGIQVGPWTPAEILSKIDAKEISWSDYLFDQSLGEWVLLMDHQEFASSFKNFLGADSSHRGAEIPNYVQGAESNSKQTQQSDEWFILKDANKHGPFKYLEMIKMLQDKALFEYDFVWTSPMKNWQAVAEVSEFSADKIRDLQKMASKENQDVFYRRRFARVSYGASLLVHNSKQVWKGRGLELSEGGAGIIVENTDFQPGQSLFLHFKAGDGVPPFNAICTIVSKQYLTEEAKTIRYGVKFVNISQSVQKAIQTYTGKAA